MEITEVRIKLMDDPQERLQAFCSVTFDFCFVIRDLKIIQGTKGSFVAMPSRKLTDRCPRCFMKNHLRSSHCNQCGAKLDESRATKDNEGRAKLYADIAHPIKSECREMIQCSVLAAYDDELIKSKNENYVCTYDDYGEENFATLKDADESVVLPPPEPALSPITIHGRGDSSHRIEPAATTPGPPHTPAQHSANSRERQTAALGESAIDDEESFGAGLV